MHPRRLNLICHESKQLKQFSCEPTSEIDLERLYIERRQDYYVKSSKISGAVKYKKIFIHDGTLKINSFDQYHLIDTFMIQLSVFLKNHVDVYVWTKNGFEKLDNLGTAVSVLERAVFTTAANITAAIGTKNLSADEYVIYDYHLLRHVLSYVREEAVSGFFGPPEDASISDWSGEPRSFYMSVSDLLELPEEERELLQASYLDSKQVFYLHLNCALPIASKNQFAAYLAQYREIKIVIPDIKPAFLAEWIDFILKYIPRNIIGLYQAKRCDTALNGDVYQLISRLYQALPNLVELSFRAEDLSESVIGQIDFSKNKKLSLLRITSYTNNEDPNTEEEQYAYASQVGALLEKIPNRVSCLELPRVIFHFDDIQQLLHRLTRLEYLGEAVDECFDDSGRMVIAGDDALSLLNSDGQSLAGLLPDIKNKIRIYCYSNGVLSALSKGKKIEVIPYSLAQIRMGDIYQYICFTDSERLDILREAGCTDDLGKTRVIYQWNERSKNRVEYNLASLDSLRMIDIPISPEIEFERFNSLPGKVKKQIKLLKLHSQIDFEEDLRFIIANCFPAVEKIIFEQAIDVFLNKENFKNELLFAQQELSDFIPRLSAVKQVETNIPPFYAVNRSGSVVDVIEKIEFHDWDRIPCFLDESADQDDITLDSATGTTSNTLRPVRKFQSKNARGDLLATAYERETIIESCDRGDDIERIDPRPFLDFSVRLQDKYSSLYRNSQDYYYTEQTYDEFITEWLQIPSLSPIDKLVHVSANQEIDLGYCRTKNLYFVRAKSKTGDQLVVSIILHASIKVIRKNSFHPPTDEHISLLRLSHIDENYLEIDTRFQALTRAEKLSAVIHYFSGFSQKELDQTDTEQSLEQRIFLQQAGVCRHRANLAYRFLVELGIEARLVQSQIHAFIEIYDEGQWITVDLGGGQAQVIYQEPEAGVDEDEYRLPPPSLGLNLDQPLIGDVLSSGINWSSFDESSRANEEADSYADLQHDAEILDEEIGTDELQFLQPIESFMPQDQDDLFLHLQFQKSSLARKQMLFVVDNWEAVPRIYQHLNNSWVEMLGTDVHIVPDLDAMKKYAYISAGGELRKYQTALANYLVANVDHGMVCISLLNSSADDDLAMPPDAASVNQLFDHRRTINDIVVPPDMFLLAIMTQKQFQEMGEDFQSRFPLIEFLDVKYLSDKIKKIKQIKPALIECTGEYTYSQLAGRYKVINNQFTYVKGEIQRYLEIGTHHFDFVHLPSSDRSLQIFLRRIKMSAEICCNGKLITIPTGFEYTVTTAEPHKEEMFESEVYNGTQSIDYVLNNSRKREFVIGSVVVQDHDMAQLPSLIEMRTGETMSLLVTEVIDQSTLIKMRELARLHQVKVKMLELSEDTAAMNSTTSPFMLSQLPPKLARENRDLYDLVLNINLFTKPVELFGKLEIVDVDTNRMVFQYTELYKYLFVENKKVLLYGDLNSYMLDYLETLYATHPYLQVNGQICYLTPGQLSVCVTKPTKIIIAQQDNAPSHSVAERVRQTNCTLSEYFAQSRVVMSVGRVDHPMIIRYLDEQANVYNGMTAIDDWLSRAGLLVLNHIEFASVKEMNLVIQCMNSVGALIWNGNVIYLSENHRILLHTEALWDTELEKAFAEIPKIDLPMIDLNTEAEQVIRDLLGIVKPSDTMAGSSLKKFISSLIDSMVIRNSAEIGHYVLRFLTILKLINEDFISITQGISSSETAYAIAHALSTRKIEQLDDIELNFLNRYLREKLSNLAVELLPAQLIQAFYLVELLDFLGMAEHVSAIGRYITFGFLIEGMPGIGKTWLVDSILNKYNFEKVDVTQSQFKAGRFYVSLPANDVARAKALLMLAERNKWLVFFDEMNTICQEARPYQERDFMGYLNSVMHSPQQERGFFAIVATQNPSHAFSTRRVIPKSIREKLIRVESLEFKAADLCGLAKRHGHSAPEQLAHDYQLSMNHFLSGHGLFRRPTIRQFIDVAKSEASKIKESKLDTESVTKRRKIEKM